MKKVLFIISFVMITAFISNVNAEEKILVPFFENNDTTNVTNGSVTFPDSLIKIGDTVKVTVMSCNTDSASTNNGIVTFSKANCTTEGLSLSWSSSNQSVATVSNGNISFLGYGTTVITASSDGYSPVNMSLTLEKESYNTSTADSEEIPNLEDEEAKIVEKDKTVEKKNNSSKSNSSLVPKTSYVGKQTSANPPTGIDNALIYVIPMLLLGVSAVIFKSKYAN